MVREVTPWVQVMVEPWMDGPVITALAKRNHWSYEQAKEALRNLGHMPTKIKVETDDPEAT